MEVWDGEDGGVEEEAEVVTRMLRGRLDYWADFDHALGFEGFLRRCRVMVVVVMMMMAMMVVVVSKGIAIALGS